MCVTVMVAGDIETHEYLVGSPAASIVGIAQHLLDRGDLDDEAVTRLRAIRELALELVRDGDGRIGEKQS